MTAHTGTTPGKKIDKLVWLCLHERRVLFARSKKQSLYFTVGGKREPGETDQQALIREVKEETSVDLVVDSITYAHTFEGPSINPADTVTLTCYFAGYTGWLYPHNEIANLDWFTTAQGECTTDLGRSVLKWLKFKNLID